MIYLKKDAMPYISKHRWSDEPGRVCHSLLCRPRVATPMGVS